MRSTYRVRKDISSTKCISIAAGEYRHKLLIIDMFDPAVQTRYVHQGELDMCCALDIFLAKPKIRKKSPQYGIIPYCRDEKTYFRGSTLLAAKTAAAYRSITLTKRREHTEACARCAPLLTGGMGKTSLSALSACGAYSLDAASLQTCSPSFGKISISIPVFCRNVNRSGHIFG